MPDQMDSKLGEGVTPWRSTVLREENFVDHKNHKVVMSRVPLDSVYQKEVLHAHTTTCKGMLASST